MCRGSFPGHRTENEQSLVLSYSVASPVERLIADTFAHLDLLDGFNPEIHMFGDFLKYRKGNSIKNRDPSDELPIFSSIKMLGNGISSAYTSNILWYSEMLKDTFRRLEWDPDQFGLFRLIVDHPIIPSTVYIVSPLPSVEK